MESRKFTYELQISGDMLDTFGHVNNAVYLELYERSRWDFIEKNGYGLEKILKEQKGPVILEVNLKFKSELRNREKILIESITGEMKSSKIMVIHQKMIKEDQTIASTLDLTIGFMDLLERKLIVPPNDWLIAVGLKS